ncbi:MULTISPECIES: zinc-binding dehydrogenase [unclassified Nocardioides]|uniref:zinc-binding dehydrogenase n=1 Tax=unclassified Nocardioides TaxID=2615069 RepID=UPI00360752CE
MSLADIPVPEPGPGQVRIRVRAAGMNRADLLHAAGRYGQRAFAGATGPDVAGMELAGVVSDVGDGVDDSLVGSRVMAMTARSYADYAVVDARLLMPVPEHLEWAEAAALPMALLTEHEALVRLGGLSAGDRVLVVGGTSGVGLVGVQLARALAPSWLVTTSRRDDSDALLRELGADRVARDPQAVGDPDGDGYDVVVDHVGGDWLVAALAHLRIGARVVSVGRLGDRSVPVDLTALAGRRARLIGTTWKTQSLEQLAESVAGVCDEVLPVVREGRVRPVIAATVDLGEITGAYGQLVEGRSPGKVVVLVSHQD